MIISVTKYLSLLYYLNFIRSQAQVDNYKLNLADRIREIFMIKPKELTSAFLSLSEEPSAARTQSHAQR